jgi:hypothetical protein
VSSVPCYLRSQKYELISYSTPQCLFNKVRGESNSLGDDVFPLPVKLKAATDQKCQSVETKGKARNKPVEGETEVVLLPAWSALLQATVSIVFTFDNRDNEIHTNSELVASPPAVDPRL